MTLPVLIIGAGLGGLCLAQALRKNNIPFELFEQDERRNFRSQGYRLRINHYGIDALEESLTPEVFDIFERTCAASAGFGVSLKPDGSMPSAMGRGGPPPFIGKSYAVDRSTFRAALLAVLENNVHFEKSFDHYVISDDKVTAHFTDGITADGCLLVGADGVRSRVRRQYIPKFAGIDTDMRIIYGKTPLTLEFLESTPKEYHKGMSLITDPENPSEPKLLFEAIEFPHANEVVEPEMPDPYVYWVLTVRREAIPYPDDKYWQINSQEAAALAEKLTELWNPAIRNVITLQDKGQSSIHSILSAIPDMPPWESSGRVTLIGDAVHVMPPTGAMGANTALRDAAALARRMAESGGVDGIIGQGVRDYEEELRVFAKKAIELSWQGGAKTFGFKPQEEYKHINL